MDKRLIIGAYRKGILTREQCAQMLGIDSEPLLGLVSGEPDRPLRPLDCSVSLGAGEAQSGGLRSERARL